MYVLKIKSFELNKNITPVLYAFLVYILSFAISKLFNTGIHESFKAFYRCLIDSFVFYWFYAFVFKDSKKNDLLKKGFLLATLVTISYGFLQFFHLDFFNRQENIERISGFHKNTYSFAGQLIVFYFFIYHEFKKNISKLFIPLSLTFFCILNSSERAVIFGVVIGTILYLVLEKVKMENLIKISLALISPFLITIFFRNYVARRLKTTFSKNGAIRKNVRFKLWKSALIVWKKNIIFGSGKFPMFIYKAGAKIQYLTHAHNTYLQILVSNGLFGLIGFLYLFSTIIKTLIFKLGKNSYSACLLCMIVSFAFEGLFEFFWGDSEVRYLLLSFTGFAFGNLLDKE